MVKKDFLIFFLMLLLSWCWCPAASLHLAVPDLDYCVSSNLPTGKYLPCSNNLPKQELLSLRIQLAG